MGFKLFWLGHTGKGSHMKLRDRNVSLETLEVQLEGGTSVNWGQIIGINLFTPLWLAIFSFLLAIIAIILL